MANDNYDPRFDDDLRYGGGPADPGPVSTAAKRKLLPPGILMILVGVLGLGYWTMASVNVYIVEDGPEAIADVQIDEFNRGVDANPDVPLDQRQQQKDAFEKIVNGVLPFLPTLLGVGVVGSLIVLVGGISMLTRLSRGLSIFASLLAMIPFVSSCCCMIGLPVGIWSLVVLFSADVKAAFAAKALPPADAY